MSTDTHKACFCTDCGSQLTLTILSGEERERFLCKTCGNVKYDNPKIIVACIAMWGDRVLWIRRGTDPRKGYWAMPAGFVEMGESLEEAVTRELFEETKATISPSSLALYMIVSLPDLGEVHLIYRAELLSTKYERTEEAMDVALLDALSAPWEDSAYPDVLEVMRRFYEDHAKGEYGIYNAEYKEGYFQFGLIGRSSNRTTIVGG